MNYLLLTARPLGLKPLRKWIVVLGCLGPLVSAQLMADTQRGAALYENHCQACHTDAIHQRNNSKVENRSALLAWITAWSTHAGLNWNKEDIEDVAGFMNLTYYRFSEDTQKTQ